MDSSIMTQLAKTASAPVQGDVARVVLNPSNDSAAMQPNTTLSLSDLEFSLSSDQQVTLDRVLDHLNQSALMPVFEVSGDLISLTLELNQRLIAMLPEAMQDDGRVVMQALTHALCDYADASGFTGFTLRMEFKK